MSSYFYGNKKPTKTTKNAERSKSMVVKDRLENLAKIDLMEERDRDRDRERNRGRDRPAAPAPKYGRSKSKGARVVKKERFDDSLDGFSDDSYGYRR